MAKYSYIIPFYNVRDYVRPCLDSVLKQTYKDWECICVDDGSPDGLWEILEEYAKKDSRFKVIRQENKGVAEARNAALSQITGDWFFFVDGDDLTSPWTCEMCEKVLAIDANVDMIRFGEICFHQDDTCDWDLDPKGMNVEIRDVSGVVDSWTYSTGHCTRAYKRSLYGDLRVPKIVVSEDRLFLLDCIFRSKKMAYVDRPISGVRRRLGSATRSPVTAQKLKASLTVVAHFLQLMSCAKKDVDPWLVRIHINRFAEALIYQLHDLRDRQTEDSIYLEWLQVMRSIKDNAFMSTFQRLRARLICLAPFRITSWLLCYVPYKLKLLGAHR